MTNMTSGKSRGLPRFTIPLLIGLILALPLTACGENNDPETNARASGPILVDPALVQGRSTTTTLETAISGEITTEKLDAVPLLRAPVPTVVAAQDCTDCAKSTAITLGERAMDAGGVGRKGSCTAKMQYGTAWAKRMPAEFPVYPNGRVQEAAGVDGKICDMRVVSFTTSAPMQTAIDYYYTRARKSGFDAEHQLRGGEHILGGTRDADGGAYVITFNSSTDKGTIVDIITNKGL